MNGIFLVSIILKGIGALLEILLQMLITGVMGVEGYGTYSAWINGADLIFWIGLSGLVKCNTFYLSGRDTSITTFKRKYYFRYALPLLAVVAVVLCTLSKSAAVVMIPLIAGLELLVLDNSSSLLARGRMGRSLIGEYVLGRVTLVAGVLLLRLRGQLLFRELLALYVLQYLLVLAFFRLRRGKPERACQDISDRVSLGKWSAYQQSDLMHSMIEQMPVVAQYVFGGAFEAGVVSIVLLVKKLINFISGPTAKIFLPEFSRLYHAGDMEGIRGCYNSIMRIQMIVVGPLAVVLLGYPGVVLRILAEELLDYRGLFMICAAIFLLTASLGPCGGILQMTGNEKRDNLCRISALGAMVLIMVATRSDAYFMLYGLCGQVALEAVGKFVSVCAWLKRSPVKLTAYLHWWLVPCLVIGLSYALTLQESFGWMALSAFGVFCLGLLRELRNKENGILKHFRKRKAQ